MRFTAPFAFVPTNCTSTITFIQLFIFTNMLELRNISPVRQIHSIVLAIQMLTLEAGSVRYSEYTNCYNTHP
jgi:hypothetical protein